MSRRAERKEHEAALAALAPVVGGEVARDDRLHGTYGGRALQVWFERLDPSPMTGGRETPRSVDVVRIRVEATGATPWYVRSERNLSLSGGHSYEFVREAGAAVLGRFSPFRDAIPVPDPEVEGRLREAGLLAAIERVAPAAGLWLPRVRFSPDPRPAMKARMLAAGVPVPPGADREGNAEVGLAIDIDRDDVHGPTPERLPALLDALLQVVELNARVNPAPPAS